MCDDWHLIVSLLRAVRGGSQMHVMCLPSPGIPPVKNILEAVSRKSIHPGLLFSEWVVASPKERVEFSEGSSFFVRDIHYNGIILVTKTTGRYEPESRYIVLLLVLLLRHPETKTANNAWISLWNPGTGGSRYTFTYPNINRITVSASLSSSHLCGVDILLLS